MGKDYIQLLIEGQVFELMIAQTIVDLNLHPLPKTMELADTQCAVVKGTLDLVDGELFNWSYSENYF